MTKRKIVRTYMDRLYCDKCGKEMEREKNEDLLFYFTMDIDYHYSCPACGDKQSSPYLYPLLVQHEGELV